MSELQSLKEFNRIMIRTIEELLKEDKEDALYFYNLCNKEDPNAVVFFEKLNKKRKSIRSLKACIKNARIIQKTIKVEIRDRIYEDRHYFNFGV